MRVPHSKHPSGKPVKKREPAKTQSIRRVPDDGFVTPKLSAERKDLSLIGFHHDFIETASDEDARKR